MPWFQDHRIASKLLGVTGVQQAFDGIVPGMPFQFVEHSPYDHMMHGEAEGFLKLHVKLTLTHLFKSKPGDQHYHALCLNGKKQHETSFNRIISKFPYNEDDRHNKPKRLKKSALEQDNSVTWSAGMMLAFAMYSTAVLGPYVDPTDPVWICW